MKNNSEPKMPLWKKILRDSIVSVADLPDDLKPQTEGVEMVEQRYPMRINSYFLSLIQKCDDAIGKQAIPDIREMEDHFLREDPLEEGSQSPVPSLIHRYPDRVVFLVSNQCAVYCRHCMRKRHVGKNREISEAHRTEAIQYISENQGIRDVILSGGDPLMLSDGNLFRIIEQIRSVRHVEIIRIHSRMLSTLPQRVTKELVDILKSSSPIFINTQFNHPSEITDAVKEALTILADSGIVLGNQSVLLKGVNDSPEILRTLFRELVKMRVRPYYLHHPDLVRGTFHFHPDIEEGLRLMSSLRGHIGGMCVPQYMIDLPGGGGKIPVLPEYILRKEKKFWVIENFEGKTFNYPVSVEKIVCRSVSEKKNA